MNDISDLLRNPLWDFRHFLTIGPPCSCGSTENEEAWHLNRQQNFCGSIHIHKVANVALESPAEKVAGSLTTCQGASKLRLNEICCSNSTNISSIFRMAHGFISALLSLKCYGQWSKINHHLPNREGFRSQGVPFDTFQPQGNVLTAGPDTSGTSCTWALFISAW